MCMDSSLPLVVVFDHTTDRRLAGAIVTRADANSGWPPAGLHIVRYDETNQRAEVAVPVALSDREYRDIVESIGHHQAVLAVASLGRFARPE